MCFPGSDKGHYLQIEANVCAVLLKVNPVLALLHVGAEEKQTNGRNLLLAS